MTPGLLVTPAELREGLLQVEGDAYRHLFRARRLAVGDELRVVDGEGRARRGVVEQVDRRSARIALGETFEPPGPRLPLALWVVPPKPERASWMVEKATELGVAQVVLMQTQRAARSVSDALLRRLERVARSALVQSGGARLPEIRVVAQFDDAVAEVAEQAKEGALLVLADPAASQTLSAAAPDQMAGVDRSALRPSVILLVGPEGGFEAGETEALIALGAQRATLGSTVLRTETAAVVGAGILLAS